MQFLEVMNLTELERVLHTLHWKMRGRLEKFLGLLQVKRPIGIQAEQHGKLLGRQKRLQPFYFLLQRKNPNLQLHQSMATLDGGSTVFNRFRGTMNIDLEQLVGLENAKVSIGDQATAWG